MQKLVVEPFGKKSCLKILHIRQSGCDIEKYGPWILEKSYSSKSEDETEYATANALGSISHSPTGNDINDGRADLRDDFREFADWAFGASGIPSLRILAYGDFSCSGRFEEYWMFLRRASSADSEIQYRFYDPKVERDSELEDLLTLHEGFLQACPTSHPYDYQ